MYCDGSFHQGENNDAQYLTHKLHFKGDVNTKLMLNHLLENKNMKSAS